jgi:prepilin-type processing-associated H-X9-DG protein
MKTCGVYYRISEIDIAKTIDNKVSILFYNPDNTLLLADGHLSAINRFDVSGEELNETAVNYDFEYRHSGGINVLTLDGYVRWRDHVSADDPLLRDLD